MGIKALRGLVSLARRRSIAQCLRAGVSARERQIGASKPASLAGGANLIGSGLQKGRTSAQSIDEGAPRPLKWRAGYSVILRAPCQSSTATILREFIGSFFRGVLVCADDIYALRKRVPKNLIKDEDALGARSATLKAIQHEREKLSQRGSAKLICDEVSTTKEGGPQAALPPLASVTQNYR